VPAFRGAVTVAVVIVVVAVIIVILLRLHRGAVAVPIIIIIIGAVEHIVAIIITKIPLWSSDSVFARRYHLRLVII
jgi:hypothetical protein